MTPHELRAAEEAVREIKQIVRQGTDEDLAWASELALEFVEQHARRLLDIAHNSREG